MNTYDTIKSNIAAIGNTAANIETVATELAGEHRVMFSALMSIRNSIPQDLGEGGDYLSQLLEFRRKVIDTVDATCEKLGV